MSIGVTGSSEDYNPINYESLAEVGDAKEALFLLLTGKIMTKKHNFSPTQDHIDVIVPSNKAFNRYDNVYHTKTSDGFKRVIFRVYRDNFEYNKIKQRFVWALDYINKILYYQIIN